MISNSNVLANENGGAAVINWSSRFAFLMASIGFAVGLGNIWRFPYITGENGGGAFVIVYLACTFLIGVPILIAELSIGRMGRSSPPNSMRAVALIQGRTSHWQAVGLIHLLAAFAIMVVYCVISGWVLSYLFKSAFSDFSGFQGADANFLFEDMLSHPFSMFAWTLLSIVITGAIIWAGVDKGIDRVVRVLMPCLLGFIVVLIVNNFFNDGFSAGFSYLFSFEFRKITPSVMLAAIGQAFFSIGVAMAGMMTYGSYLPRQVSIPKSAAIIVLSDTAVALMAGLVIFPLVFRFGLDPSGGAGLIFKTLPVAFGQMPGGYVFSIFFFLMLSIAAITSMVGLVEPHTRWLEEKGFSRHKSALMILGLISVLSTISIMGYGSLSQYSFFGRDINGSIDFFSNQILLPIGGFLIAIFIGWFVGPSHLKDELDIDSSFFRLWYFLVRFVVPASLFLIFIFGLYN